MVITSHECFRVIAEMASFIPIDNAKACFSDLLTDFKLYCMTIDLTSVAVSALVRLCKQCVMNKEKMYFTTVKSG